MEPKDIDSLVRPNILALEPYSTARDEYSGGSLGVFLDANESPYENGVNRYPDPHQKMLKSRISEIKGIGGANIFLGNGSDEAIDIVFRVFCTPGRDKAIAISPSYGMYKVASATNDIALEQICLNEDWSLPVDRILEAAGENVKVIFLCSPNNPTGNAFPREDILRIVDGFRGIVVVDEAYADFSSLGSLAAEACTKGNLIVLQTLSKAWGMAGLRIGMAFACERVIGLMSRVKYPYNINVAAQTQALRMLRMDTPFTEEIISERTRLAGALTDLRCIVHVWPSDANFLLVRTTDADGIYAFLTSRGIIVRNRSHVPMCGGCLRITVGLKEENDKLLEALKEYEESHLC